MKKLPASWLAALGVGCAATLMAFPAASQNVKITPLGTHDGELCSRDRALIFEDPNGTRILFDPGMSVMGGEDPRLGKIDVVLVTHMHSDHVGGVHLKELNGGTCAAPDVSVRAYPNTNAVNIALAKKSKMVTGSEMHIFFAAKLRALGGNPADSLPARFGGGQTVGGVRITTVNAVHPNGAEPDAVGGEIGKSMKEAGVGGYVGDATGYVLRFTNGLVVYMSGDTGITTEMQTVVNGFYRAKLAVMNIGDVLGNGPNEAAYAVNDLVKPVSVIASHTNEGSTQSGKAVPGSKLEAFMKLSKPPVHVPLSGKTMEFDAGGKCVAGC